MIDVKNNKGVVTMQKTKLGVTVGLVGATLYFLALINTLSLILLAGYVLLFETNEWLKKSAVKAVAVAITFSLIPVAVSFGSDIFSLLNAIMSWFNSNARLSYPLNLNTIINSSAYGLQKIILLLLGFKALTQGSMSVGPLDEIVNKNM